MKFDTSEGEETFNVHNDRIIKAKTTVLHEE